MRTCIKCGRTSEKAAFYPSVKTRCKRCVMEANDAWRKRNPTYMKEYSAKRRESKGWKSESHRYHRYGLTPSDFQAMVDAQDGRCAICATEFTSTPNVDHDHATGAVRGLLCPFCNSSLPIVEMHLEAAVAYLREGKFFDRADGDDQLVKLLEVAYG